MNLEDERTQDWLLGGILTALLVGGVVVAGGVSIVLRPLPACVALGPGRGGGGWGPAPTRRCIR